MADPTILARASEARRAAVPSPHPAQRAAAGVPAHLVIVLEAAEEDHDSGSDAARALSAMAGVALEDGIGTLTWVVPPGEGAALAQRAAVQFLRDERKSFAERVYVHLIAEEEASRAELSDMVRNWPEPRAPRLVLNIVAGHDGRADLVQAVRRLAELAQQRGLAPEIVDASQLEQQLPTHALPPVDLLVRTGGATTLENYLLWQSAYAELLFVAVPWTRLDRAQLQQALADYARRCRKFGGLA